VAKHSFEMGLGRFVQSIVYSDTEQDVPMTDVVWEYEQSGTKSWFTEDGRIVRVSAYSFRGIEQRRTIFEYTDSNQIAKIDEYRGGQLSGREVFRYDENDRLQSHLVYGPDGNPIGRAEFSYPDSSSQTEVHEQRRFRKSGEQWGPIGTTIWELDANRSPISSRTFLDGDVDPILEYSLSAHGDGSSTITVTNVFRGTTVTRFDRYGRVSFVTDTVKSVETPRSNWSDWKEVETDFPAQFARARESVNELFGERITDQKQIHFKFDVPHGVFGNLRPHPIRSVFTDFSAVRAVIMGGDPSKTIFEPTIAELMNEIDREISRYRMSPDPPIVYDWLIERMLEEQINEGLPATHFTVVVGER